MGIDDQILKGNGNANYIKFTCIGTAGENIFLKLSMKCLENRIKALYNTIIKLVNMCKFLCMYFFFDLNPRSFVLVPQQSLINFCQYSF